MANKSTSANAKNAAQVYKTSRRWETNRLKRLKRALKRNPENAEQIETAMKSLVYRRKTPSTSVWSSTDRRTAQLFKKFTGYGALTPKAKAAVESNEPKRGLVKTISFADMSLLRNRARDAQGNLVWA